MAAVSKRVGSAQFATRGRAAGMRSALRDAAWEEGRSSGRTGLKRPRGMSSDSTGPVRSDRIHKGRGTFPTNLTHTPSEILEAIRPAIVDAATRSVFRHAPRASFPSPVVRITEPPLDSHRLFP